MALVNRITLEADSALGTKYLRHSLTDYTSAVNKLDKQSFLELLEADCERWKAEVDLEI